MKYRGIVWICLFSMLAVSARAQDTRTLRTKRLDLAEAPVRITAYEAVMQPYQDGFYTFSLLEETLTLENVTQADVTAVDIGLVYASAFGEEIERAFEAVIGTVAAGDSRTVTFRHPLESGVPLYTAVAYVSRVRMVVAGRRDTVWMADSTRVDEALDRLINDFELAQRHP